MNNGILNKIRENAKFYPEEIAVRYKNEEVTFKEFEEETNYIAYCLQDYISFRNEPVIIYQPRGVKFIEYMVGIMKCGCCYIPIEDNIPRQRLEYIIADVGAKIIISDDESLNSIPSISRIPIKQNRRKEYDNADIKDEDLVYIMYTSGTSGVPKGVKIMYKNLENLIFSFEKILYSNFAIRKNVGVLAAFTFDSSVKQIFNALFYGHTLVIAEERTKYFGRSIHAFHENNDIDICDVTPSILELMTRQKTPLISKTQFLLIGGENLRWETLRNYITFAKYVPTFINLYGPTECCVDCSYKVIEKEEINNSEGYVSIGEPVRNTFLYIVDENGNEIDDMNIEGELIVSGEQVGAGYIKGNNESFFIHNGIRAYKTGDKAFYTKEGIIIRGRVDNQVKLHGNRIELDEINANIENFWGCNCVTLKWENDKKQNLVVYACKPYIKKDEKLLISYLREILPSYMLPSVFLYGDLIPINNHGKVDKTKIYGMVEKKLEGIG